MCVGACDVGQHRLQLWLWIAQMCVCVCEVIVEIVLTCSPTAEVILARLTWFCVATMSRSRMSQCV
eukprot:m.196263 g.196263  ORF g.196263 m.196263 type:complete len:66 (-) comp19727_c0_seq1:81-278(-)